MLLCRTEWVDALVADMLVLRLALHKCTMPASLSTSKAEAVVVVFVAIGGGICRRVGIEEPRLIVGILAVALDKLL